MCIDIYFTQYFLVQWMQTFFQKNRNEITITPVSGSNKTKEDIVMLVSVLYWIYHKK